MQRTLGEQHCMEDCMKASESVGCSVAPFVCFIFIGFVFELCELTALASCAGPSQTWSKCRSLCGITKPLSSEVIFTDTNLI
jgi:hypothetical protein